MKLRMRLRVGQSRVDIGFVGLGAVAVLVALTVSDPGVAEPLGKEACEALVVEQQALITAGVKDDVAKGPVWGKANLNSGRLAQVGRYLDVEEQLSFRCGLAKIRYSLPADEETPAPPVAEEPKAPAKAKPAPKVKAKASAKAQTATSEEDPGTKGVAEKTAPTAPKAQAKAKPTAKASDAFKPDIEPGNASAGTTKE